MVAAGIAVPIAKCTPIHRKSSDRERRRKCLPKFVPAPSRDSNRAGLAADDTVTGPAVIEAVDATIVIPPSWRAAVNADGHLIMEAGHGE